MAFKYLGKKPPHAVLIIDEGAMDEYSVMKRDIAKATQQDQQSKREEHFRGALKEAANVIHGWTHESIVNIKYDSRLTKQIRTAPNQSHLERLEEMLLVSAGEGEER